MVEKAEEEAAEEERNPGGMEMEVEEDDTSAGKGFQWKVAANTHYLWSTSGGGATRMNVNFGKKAPPSAARRHKVNVATGEVVNHSDASQHHVRTSITKVKKKIQITENVRRSVSSVTMVEAEDIKNKTVFGFAEQLGEVLTEEEARAAPMEQLAEDSDFKIEYAFEEVEVAV